MCGLLLLLLLLYKQNCMISSFLLSERVYGKYTRIRNERNETVESVCTRKMDFMIWKTKVLVRFIWWIFAVAKKPRAEVEECSYCGIGIAVTIEYDEYIRNREINGWEWRPFWAIIETICSNQKLSGMVKWPPHIESIRKVSCLEPGNALT